MRDYTYVRQFGRLDHLSTQDRKQRLKDRIPHLSTQLRHIRPFESHYYALPDGEAKVDFLRDKFRRWLPTTLSYSSKERRFRAREFQEGEPPKEISEFVDRVVRLFVALIGGAFLVVPMIIMTINQSVTKSLVIAPLSVLLFAVVISFGVRTTNAETLVATATYAAVLVVFVGSAQQGAVETGKS